LGHDGGMSFKGVSIFSDIVPSSVHLTFQILPWSSRMFFEPAFWWSPSMFWVMSETPGKIFSHRARILWPGLGSFGEIIPRRQSYHSQTSLGSWLKASGVASSSARYFFHRPSSPRKVGMPDSAEIPAHVKTATRVVLWRISISGFISSFSGICSPYAQ
jgi:hypothetical protein